MTTSQSAAPRQPYALIFSVLMLLALLTVGPPAHAQLTFSLVSNYLAGNAGDTLSYHGTLTNTGTEEVFLNGDFSSLVGEDLTLDDSPFFSNFPLSLLSNESVSGEMFTVTIGPTTPQELYTGTFSIQGGPTDGDFNVLATQTFGVAVGAPEPMSLGLTVFGGAALFGITRYSRKSTRA